MRDTLTKEEVEQIRTLANTPGITYKAVAEKFGIDENHVRYIANRKNGNK